MKKMRTMAVSVVVPVYNEEQNLRILNGEILAALTDLGRDLEVIYVDDGSSDGSLQVLKELASADKRIKVINFRRNFGQSAAISAGFEHCRGRVVVTLDADLQNDPADIPQLLAKLAEGYDMVNGWRHRRQDKLLTRRLPSRVGNWLISWISGVHLHDYGCTLRVFRCDVVKNLKLYSEMHRYIPAIASRLGVRFTEMKVNHRPRRFGSSKYGIGRAFRVFLDLISLKFLLSYSHRPLQVFGGSGLIMILAGLGSGLILTYQKYILLQPIAGRPLLFLTLLLIFLGFQFITLGLIAEMLTRIYHEGLEKSFYVIREKIGFSDENPDDRSPTIF